MIHDYTDVLSSSFMRKKTFFKFAVVLNGTSSHEADGYIARMFWKRSGWVHSENVLSENLGLDDKG